VKYLYDKRKSKNIQEEIKILARSYLPQWKINDGEPGWTLAKIFSFMHEDVHRNIIFMQEIPTLFIF